ncbi:MAG: DinB family protein [Chthoniobacterales bacterium]
MKTPSLIVAALLFVTGSVHAQSSPAANVAGASGSLTKEERARAIDYLKQTQTDFLASIDGVSDEQWKFKAAPERWSIAETAEHIAVAEELIFNRLKNEVMKSPAAPEKKAEVAGKEDLIMKAVPDRSRKAQAPEVLKPTGRFATRADLIKQFNDTRAQEIAYLSETNDDLHSHFGEHPLLKTMDGYQWLILNGAHCKRHTAQIAEVKEDANYPKK